ncbi:TetR/AcrR family transcriptional regulator [Agromyces larvae]|uniref:TetR/AcrR family transcriptional regulator n=1 Tax=Agromyces larvae TaxID=2929802 RepID=A0ABY4C372_9MICO|nr:TetR/AcrR family transcriptional regulator [Agromyces larvae]UOE45449.1 TetR/AcrR family transcriptional regulator [Agromyces larvae]
MPTDLQAPARLRASDELRQAALEQFASAGFAGTSLQQIAAHAGYAKSSVLYHYASKEALLEAAVTPAVDALDELVAEFVRDGRSGAVRGEFVERFVDFLLGHRLAVHIVVNQAQSLHGLPVIDRANAVIRTLAEAICADDAPLIEQLRFGVALAGAVYTLVAGATFLDDDPSFETDPAEVRDALVAVLTELLVPASGR